METITENKNTLVDTVLRLIVVDILEYNEIGLTENQAHRLSEILKEPFGAIYWDNGELMFTSDISHPTGSTDLIVKHGFITTSEYIKVEQRPQFVQDIMDTASHVNDIVSLCKMIGYPLKQLIDPDFVDISSSYLSLLERMSIDITPTLNLAKEWAGDSGSMSKFDVKRNEIEVRDRHFRRLEEYLNE